MIGVFAITRELYRLKREDIPRAVERLKDAFKEDPIWEEIFKNDPDRDRALTGFYTCPLLYGMKFGKVYAPSHKIEGVAVWLPDRHATMTPLKMLLSNALFHCMSMGKESARNLTTLSKQLEADRKRLMKERSYLYLSIIGIGSQAQRKGLGSRLMRAIIEECSRKKLYLYLETETEENTRFYEKHGLTLLQKTIIEKINLPMWQLVYRP